MRTSLFIFLISLLSLGCSIAREGHRIEVHIQGVTQGECQLAYHFGNRQYLQTTAAISPEGVAVFASDERLQPGIYLIALPDESNFELIIDDNQHFTVHVNPSDLTGSTRFEGSPQNQAFYQYLAFLRDQGEKRQQMQMEINGVQPTSARAAELTQAMEALDQGIMEYQNNIIAADRESLLSKVLLAQREPEMPEIPLLEDGSQDREAMYKTYTARYFNNIDLTDERLLYTPVYHSKLRVYFNNVLMQVPDTIIAEAHRLLEKTKANEEVYKYTLWFIASNAESSQIMGMDAVFVYMVEEYYLDGKAYWMDPEQIRQLEERVKRIKPLMLGNVAPEATLFSPGGERISINDVEAEYLILYFWDSECFYCREATPFIRSAHQALKQYGVKVMAINTEMDEQRWKQTIEQYPGDWIHVNDLNNLSGYRDNYEIYSIPAIFILDKEKRILAKQFPAEHVEAFLRQQMNR